MASCSQLSNYPLSCRRVAGEYSYSLRKGNHSVSPPCLKTLHLGVALKLFPLVLIWACYASLVAGLLGQRAIRPPPWSISGPMNERTPIGPTYPTMEWRYWPFQLHRRVVLRSEKSLRQSVAPWTHCKIKCCRNPGLGSKMVWKFPRKSQPCYCGQRPCFFTGENPRGSSSRCNSQSSAVFYLCQRHNKSQCLRLWHQLIRRWHFSIRVIANRQCTSSQASASGRRYFLLV